MGLTFNCNSIRFVRYQPLEVPPELVLGYQLLHETDPNPVLLLSTY